ncbi:FAD-binding oxidoreductase [Actinomadura rudentiformis]|uniref:FAD-binding oxidoreductase n=1 Tax=Actinomadura rudentiformis TaxID=359158 RepID=A0A6H9YRW4_9ACTN|nr:FAD-binding oxidoreductase [Actinomadura rudentiformis]KAB2342173.1 FAD-binding oxidoreductase [Actinomadura rudentiformis]
MNGIEALAERVDGAVIRPGDGAYDSERVGYQLAGPHRPDLIVAAVSAADVQAAVEFAAANALPVAVQATGHGVPADANEGVLISTRRMNGLSIDAESRTAWVEAGVRWREVVQEAASHGLAPLNGSYPGVGAVSYTLGGGIGLLARRYGNAVDRVRRIEVVTADATLRTVSPEADPDLFWALRGGRGNFGVVTGMEIELVPVSTIYGGGLYFDTGLAAEALRTFQEWSADVPDEMTSSIALMPFPDIPQIPEVFRGRHIAHIRIAYAGDPADGERLVAPLRALGPRLIDTVETMPYAKSATIHDEPDQPMAYRSTHVLLDELSADAVQAVLDLAGPGASERAIVEVRHLGGALSVPPAIPSAVGNRGAQYLVGVLSKLEPTETPDASEPVHSAFLGVMKPWATGGRHLNFLFGDNATEDEVRAAYEPEDFQRLAELKALHDPADMFRLTHHIRPAER